MVIIVYNMLRGQVIYMRNFIGANVKAIRTHYGLSQEQVGRMAGVKQGAVSSWELGTATPRRKSAEMLARSLGIDYDDIMSEERGFARKPFEDGGESDALPELPVCRRPYEVAHPEVASERYIAPPSATAEHPTAVYVEVPDDRVNRKIPRGYIAMVDTDIDDPEPGRMHCVLVDGEMVFGRVQPLTNGFEVLPDSYDPTARPVVVDTSSQGVERIGIVVRATMPDWYEI